MKNQKGSFFLENSVNAVFIQPQKKVNFVEFVHDAFEEWMLSDIQLKNKKKTVRIKWNCELKNRKSRCGMCKKKIKLTPFDCKCDKVFCLRHKAREDHDCTFDYLEKGNEELSEEIPLVVAEKVRHI